MVRLKTKKSAFEEFQQLEAAALEADRAVQEAESKKRRRVREYTAASGDLTAYFSAVGAGDVPDEARERELRVKVDEARGRLAERMTPDGRNGMRVEMFDPEAEGRIAGAMQRQFEAADAVSRFVIEHRDELQAELVGMSIQAGDARMRQAEAFLHSDRDCDRLRRLWVRFGVHWGFAPNEVPLAGFDGIALQDVQMALAQAQGGAKDPRGMYPMPVRLAPGGDPERVEYAGSMKGWAHMPRVISSEGGLLGA